jgi:hypothetical protein
VLSLPFVSPRAEHRKIFLIAIHSKMEWERHLWPPPMWQSDHSQYELCLKAV